MLRFSSISGEYVFPGILFLHRYVFYLCYFLFLGQLYLLSLPSQHLAEWEGEEKPKLAMYGKTPTSPAKPYWFALCLTDVFIKPLCCFVIF